ncbi:MAG: DUF2255 family protein [Pseudomonadota bacterium]
MRDSLTGLLLMGLFCVAGCCGPLGPLAGGKLAGETASYPVGWNLARSTEHVQLETYDADGDAHSVNTWSVVHGERLYIASSMVRGQERPEKRRWVRNAMAAPDARLKVDAYIYSGVLRRIEDGQLVSAIKAAFVLKYAIEENARTRDAWVFEFANPKT